MLLEKSHPFLILECSSVLTFFQVCIDPSPILSILHGHHFLLQLLFHCIVYSAKLTSQWTHDKCNQNRESEYRRKYPSTWISLYCCSLVLLDFFLPCFSKYAFVFLAISFTRSSFTCFLPQGDFSFDIIFMYLELCCHLVRHGLKGWTPLEQIADSLVCTRELRILQLLALILLVGIWS